MSRQRMIRVRLLRADGVFYAYCSTGLFGWRFAVATTAHEALRRVLPRGVDPAQFLPR